MNFQSLEYSVAAAQLMSFIKAAEQLYVTQPTLSRGIKALERELGCLLFEGTPRALQLTEAGAVCLDEAQKILKACKRLPLAVAHTTGEISGTVRVGYIVNGQVDTLLEKLGGFLEEHPSVQLESIYDSPSAAKMRYLNGELDMLMMNRVNCDDIPDKEVYTLCPSALCIMVLKGHPLFHAEQIRLEQLRNERIVTTSPDQMPALCEFYVEMCRRVGFEPNIVGSGEKLNDIKLQMIQQRAIAFASVECMHMNSHNLHVIPVADEMRELDSVVICRRHGKSRCLQLLCSALSGCADLLL